MSRNAKVTAPFAGDEYEFRMAWGDILKLQEKRDLGPYEITMRLHNGTWRIEDIREVIRIGLIGGGMAVPLAAKLVREHVEGSPIMEYLALAQIVMQAGLVGTPDEPPGELVAAGMQNELTISQNGKLRAAKIYGGGAVLGFSPQQMDEMSLWQIGAVFEGWNKAHTPEETKAPGQRLSEGEKDEIWEWMQTREEEDWAKANGSIQ